MFSDHFLKFRDKMSSSEHNHHHDRNIYDVFKKVLRFRKGLAAVFTLLFSFTVTVSYASPQYYDVAIVDGDNLYDYVSPNTTVNELLTRTGVELGEYDKVSPELSSYVSSAQTVVIQRVKKVSVTIGEETKEYFTTEDTVGAFLKERGIDVNYHDIINLPLETKLEIDNKLEIVRVMRRIVKVETEIPFETRTVSDTSMSISDSKIVTPGVNGIDCETYEVLMYNGVEVQRQLVSKER